MKTRRLIAAVSAFGVLILAVLLFLLLFQIKIVTVEGNIHYTEGEIKSMVMDGTFSGNSVILSITKRNMKAENIPFLESIRVEMTSRDSVRLVVTEKNIVGYLLCEDSYWYFNRHGMVVEKTEEPVQTAEERLAEASGNDADGTVQRAQLPAKNFVPLVEGLVFDHIEVGEVLDISNPDIFGALSAINQMVNKDNIPPDKVIYDEDGNISLIYGEIEVLLGKDEKLEEKMNTLASIMPEMEGMSGLLHLENYQADQSGVIFEKKS